MDSLEPKQSQQERASSQVEKPKGEQTKTDRRTFLKKAGIASAGLCAPGLPKLAAAKTKEPKEPDKSLNEEIAELEPEEKAALTTFLKGLWEVDRMLSPSLVQMYLNLTQAVVERQEKTAKVEKAKQEERKHRDSLMGQAKVDYFVSQLTKDCCCYCPPFQRDVLKLIVKSEPSQSDWETTHDSKTYLVGTINRTFEGCRKSLRQKVVAQYLRDVMPALEVKYKQEKAEQEAYDNLVSYLSNNKTIEEVVTLTKQLKRAGTGKGVSV